MEHYQIIKEIGSGFFGVVLAASDERNNEIVAIKKLKSKCYSEKEVANITEIKALRKMNHPNIVKLKETIIEHDILYLVFEYMESSLSQRMITRSKPFSEDEIRDLCFQIFQGLAYMHANGYFHRDMKPDNLLVSGGVIKIADLGLARKTNEKQPYDYFVGTRLYRAPELVLRSAGQVGYDCSVDMWAMGAIMAELFTNQPLFPCRDAKDQIYKICSVIGTPTETTWSEGLDLARDLNYQYPQLPGVHLSSLLPSASPEALDLIASLLSWSPRSRPTAMEALHHPFFYTYNHVPRQTLPQVFNMEMKQTTSVKSCTFHSEKMDPMEDLSCVLTDNSFDSSGTINTSDDLIMLQENLFCDTVTVHTSRDLSNLLQENPSYDTESVDTSEDLSRLLPENPSYGTEPVDTSEDLSRLLSENPSYDTEAVDTSEDLSCLISENPSYDTEPLDTSEDLSRLLSENPSYDTEPVDTSGDLSRLISENPSYDTEPVDTSEDLSRLLSEHPLYDTETNDTSEDLIRMLRGNPVYDTSDYFVNSGIIGF